VAGAARRAQGAVSAEDRIFLETTRRYATPKMSRDDVRAALELAQVAPDKRVADLGCGYGRHLKALVEEGYQPFGVDRSELLLAEARRQAPRANLLRADLRRLPLNQGTLAAAFCFYSSMFLGTHEAAQTALREAARVLESGGSLVLTQDNPARLAKHPKSHFQDEVPGLGRVIEESEFDGTVDRVTKRLERPGEKPLSATFVIRYYPPFELADLARGAGLSLKRFAHEPVAEAKQLIALLEKDG
jgi:SAM-dependent methyltransferase